MGSVATLHFCTLTDSIKLSLLFSFLLCVTCFQRTVLHNFSRTSNAGANADIYINVNTVSAVLEVKKGNKDDLEIIFHIFQ